MQQKTTEKNKCFGDSFSHCQRLTFSVECECLETLRY